MLPSCLCWPALSQTACTGSFSGTIVDSGGKPVIGAAIIMLPQQQGQSSNELGEFMFNDVCNGIYSVKVQYLGYEDVQFDIQVTGPVKKTIVVKEQFTQLNEVIIQHHDAAHTENATNFAQINEKQIAESAGKSLGETMKDIPGVTTIQTGPGIFKPVIHGLNGQRILILNHGIRQEGQQWGAEHAPEIDPFVAGNIVVIKDASAIKYGTDALGGTIIVNPPELPDEAGLNGTVNSVFQSNGRSAVLSGMLEGGLKEHRGWGWRIQSSAKRTGDFHAPDYMLTNTGIKELNFSGALGYHKKNAGFDVFFSRFQTEIGILKGTAISNLDDLVAAMERSEPLYTTDFSYSITAPRQKVSHNLVKLSAHMLTKKGEWRIQYGFQNNNRREYDIRIGDLSKIPAIDLRLDTHTFDTEWETLHQGKATLSLGINTMLQNNQNIPGTQRVPFIPNFFNVSGGVYGVTKINFEAWAIDLGARYDYRHYEVKGFDFKNTLYSTVLNFNNVSGTAGATWQFKKDQLLRFNLSSAWRPPHVAELFSLGTHQSAAAIEYGLLLNDSTNEIMNLADVHFKIEQAVKFVTTYQLTRSRLSVEVSPYANYIFNYTYLRPAGITQNTRGVYPYFRYTQTNALFVGVDISSTWQATPHFKVGSTISLLRASDELNDDYLVFIPANRYELSVRYGRPSAGFGRNFYAESKFKYVAKQYRAPRVLTVSEIKQSLEDDKNPLDEDASNFDFMAAPDGYFLWNLAAGISIKSKKTQYDFRLASENTLNQAYREYSNRFRYYADDIGRNIMLSIKCIF